MIKGSFTASSFILWNSMLIFLFHLVRSRFTLLWLLLSDISGLVYNFRPLYHISSSEMSNITLLLRV